MTAFVHDVSYAEGPASRVHQARLISLARMLRDLDLPASGHLADFGCSNGFILQTIQPLLPGWECTGFDRHPELLEMGRAKNLPKTTFKWLELNRHNEVGPFDLVTCLETLEHVGNYKTAISTIIAACGQNLIVSVPYEKGIPGMVKYLARKILRRNAYGDFFKEKSELAYFFALLFNRRIDTFRNHPDGLGEHLGFDNRIFEDYLMEQTANAGLRLISKRTSFFGFNVIYGFKRHHASV